MDGLNLLGVYGKDDLAKVYIASVRGDRNSVIEFVESLQPPIPRDEKWVLIVSSMIGCPVKCKMCDAGGSYRGRLTAEEIIGQIDYMIRQRYPEGTIPIPKFKIQFARMGEPVMNPAVLDVLNRLPQVYDAPGLTPSVSTIAPKNKSADGFFQRLQEIKNTHYSDGHFQLQFSIHTTDVAKRDELIPVKKWNFEDIAEYCAKFYQPGDRKVTLNFAGSTRYPIDPTIIRRYFDPQRFIIKITPLNPTSRVRENQLESLIDPFDEASWDKLIKKFETEGFEVILSIGELEENLIGSNCGQFVTAARSKATIVKADYQTTNYPILKIEHDLAGDEAR